MKSLFKTRLFKASTRLKYNFVYLLYCLYELRYGKILLNNYGYYPSALTQENQYQLQFYLELMLAGKVSKTDALTVCEIGCGQGHGGLFLLQHYLQQDSQFIGLDASEIAIQYCKWKHRHIKNARFKVNRYGIPFDKQSFDIFLSVETGVPRSSEVLHQIYHCLKASGLFIFYETYNTQEEKTVDTQLASNGFLIEQKINVTQPIVQALIQDNTKKLALLNKLWFLPEPAIAFLKDYLAMVGTKKFESYQQNQRNGFIYVLRAIPEFNFAELIIAHIDSWDGQYLRGWAFCLANQNSAITLQIIAEEKVIAETTADLPRHDVASIYGKEYLNTGFSVALPITPEQSYYLTLVESNTGRSICHKPFVIAR